MRKLQAQGVGCDGRTLTVEVDHVVAPGYTRTLSGEGMPCKTGRGNLVIEFDIQFPKRLKPKDKSEALMDALPS